jgi:hypothetical protein
MVDCGSAGVWDRGIIGMWNVLMRSGVYCLLYGDEYYGGVSGSGGCVLVSMERGSFNNFNNKAT